MSHLDHITTQVKANGFYEEPWVVLINTHFRGDDAFEKIKTWANSVGLSVAFSESQKTCRFWASAGQATPPPRA